MSHRIGCETSFMHGSETPGSEMTCTKFADGLTRIRWAGVKSTAVIALVRRREYIYTAGLSLIRVWVCSDLTADLPSLVESMSLCLYSDVPVQQMEHSNINIETQIPFELRTYQVTSSNGICVSTFIFGCLPVPQSSNARIRSNISHLK